MFKLGIFQSVRTVRATGSLALVCGLAFASPASAWTSNCENASAGIIPQPDLPGHTGVVTFAPGYSGNAMKCTGYQEADHAQGKAPLAGPKFNANFSNAWTFKVKFASTPTSNNVTQVFFQIFQKHGVGWGSNTRYQPIIMLRRQAGGGVWLKTIHTTDVISQDAAEVYLGNAPLDVWLQVKVAATFTVDQSTSSLKGYIIPVSSASPEPPLITCPIDAGLIRQRSDFYNSNNQQQFNPDMIWPYLGNYTWALGSFEATSYIDDVWQQYASWGYSD